MPNDVLNCHWEFRTQCPKRWEELSPTDSKAERFCETCQQRVYNCKTEKQLVDAIRAGRCVTFKSKVDDEPRRLLGVVVLNPDETD
jgi:hypothetical protein